MRVNHSQLIPVICGSDGTLPFAKRRGRGSEATAGDAPGGRALKASPLPRTPPSFPRRREPRACPGLEPGVRVNHSQLIPVFPAQAGTQRKTKRAD